MSTAELGFLIAIAVPVGMLGVALGIAALDSITRAVDALHTRIAGWFR